MAQATEQDTTERTDRELLREIAARLAKLERIIDRALEHPAVKLWMRGLRHGP